MKLRVMTFNIQHGADHAGLLAGGGENLSLSRIASEIAAHGADLCGLNEVRGKGLSKEYGSQAAEIAYHLGYHDFFGRSIYVRGTEPYGNAVVSRMPIREAKVIPIPDPPNDAQESRSILRCEVEFGEGLVVYISHFGLTKGEKENAAELAYALLKAETRPAILMGDFNMVPTDPLMAPLLREFDEVNSGNALCPTFPSHAPQVKIDYIFTANGVRVTDWGVGDRIVSDHLPIFADLVF